MHRSIAMPALALALAAGAVHAQDGLLDSNFGIFGTGRNVIAHDQGGGNADQSAGALVAPDGSIYLVGTAQTAGGSRQAITRLTAAGIRDESFGVGGTVYSSAADLTARRARFDGAGNLLVAGFRTVSGTNTDFHLCRYTPQGQPLPFTAIGSACVTIAFDTQNEERADVVNDLLVEPEGRILLVGTTRLPGGVELGAIARLRGDGSFDATYGIQGKRAYQLGPTPVTRFNAIDLTTDGKYVVVGEFGSPDAENGTSALMAILSVSGNPDPGFQAGAGFAGLAIDGGAPFNRDEAATGVRVLRDGTILVIGNTQIADSSVRYRLFAYKIVPAPLLTLDAGFGSNGRVLIEDGHSLVTDDLLVQSDGRIALIGTRRATEAFALDMAVLRLRRDGSPDPAFGSNGRVYLDFVLPGEFDYGTRIASQAGRLIVAGHSLRASPQNYDLTVARLGNDGIFADDLE
ncbi:MAG TPA: hypothetical protein VMR06_04540 [Dokdonella sp.]|uniref:hypothetical protein n=1 Tax=Dokdonella sp. TaxID=2291710 RepID=UPI002B71B876|nr:hypothetical protein [Dokdonella sp.]HUD41247.1 hypothetical protein [Dokdonella sp.]